MKNHSKHNKKSKGNRGGSNITRINTIGGVSDRQRVKLRYSMITAVTNIVTTGAFSYVFRGNSGFDPDFTAAGAQPANWDDYSALYKQYRVWSSTIRVHIVPGDASSEPTLWAVGPRHVSTTLTAATQMDFLTQPYVQGHLRAVNRIGAPDSTVTMSMSTAKMEGLSNTEFQGRDDLTALVTANPAQQWFWHVCATNVDTSVTGSVAIYVELTYDVEFFERVDTAIDLMGRLQELRNARPSHPLKGGGRHTGLQAMLDEHDPYDRKFSSSKESDPRPGEVTPDWETTSKADDPGLVEVHPDPSPTAVVGGRILITNTDQSMRRSGALAPKSRSRQ